MNDRDRAAPEQGKFWNLCNSDQNSRDALQVADRTESSALAIGTSVHEQLAWRAVADSTCAYFCICQSYTTNQRLAAEPSSNSRNCSLPAQPELLEGTCH